ncbi:uncharacterized protein LOC133201789 [Saccostrea echinata]|uniref:uncharacterized protein LOC133201789 n=1 Tax=Saccostrea echinata TaxID=191078 RepID=UPI002A82C4C9|nr:uncharacterized protein LOC133201789 [Saccostrea echinata]
MCAFHGLVHVFSCPSTIEIALPEEACQNNAGLEKVKNASEFGDISRCDKILFQCLTWKLGVNDQLSCPFHIHIIGLENSIKQNVMLKVKQSCPEACINNTGIEKYEKASEFPDLICFPAIELQSCFTQKAAYLLSLFRKFDRHFIMSESPFKQNHFVSIMKQLTSEILHHNAVIKKLVKDLEHWKRTYCDFDFQFCIEKMTALSSCPLDEHISVLESPLDRSYIMAIVENLYPKVFILDFFEVKQCKKLYLCDTEAKSILFRLPILLPHFLHIIKDCYLSDESFGVSFSSSILIILPNSLIKGLCYSGLNINFKSEDKSQQSTDLLEYNLRNEEIRAYVKKFFKQHRQIESERNKAKETKAEIFGVKKNIKQGKHYKSFDECVRENINEILSRVEIRHDEIVVYPATQQPVLEPILNKFSVPESAPSKHDTMAVEFLRLCTMHDYPNTNGPSLLRLAQAGFFYEGNGNELVCFSCDFRKGSWNFNDSPREIHLRMSPNCKFLSQGDGNVPVPREESTQDLVPLQSVPQVGVVEPDGPWAAYNGSTSNNTAHLASANYSNGQDQSETTRRTMVVKHPEYASRPARLASYANFPRHMKQHPADMTDAGFYYAGFGDCCRCFHCGIGLRNWDPEDNPWIEHARWSMECPYILKIKGQAFIDLVQEAARAAEMAQDDEDSEAEGASTGNESDSGNKEKSGASNSASGGPAANEIENNVAKTSEATMSKGTSDDSGFGSGSAPVAQPIKAPLRTAAAQSLIHDEKIKPKYVTAAIEDLVKAEGWGAFTKENIRKYLKIHEENRKSASSASNADPSTLKQENKELKDLTICKICLDEKVSIVFLPCGHLVSCPQCAPALTKCPICRKNIKGTVRTNLVEKSTAR